MSGLGLSFFSVRINDEVKEIAASASGQHQGREGKKQMLMSFAYFEKSRKELLSYGCSCIRCKLNWNSVVLFIRRMEIRKTLRKTSRNKGNNQQEPQPTREDDSRIRTYLTAAPIFAWDCAQVAAGILTLKALGHKDIDVLAKFLDYE